MSAAAEMTERELTFGLIKLSLSLVGLFLLVAVGLTLIAGNGQSVAVNALLVCVAFGFLTNGCLAILKIVDWFEARKQHNG